MRQKLSYSTPLLVEAAAVAAKTRRTGKRATLLSIALTAACVAGVINSATAGAADTSTLTVQIDLDNIDGGTVKVVQQNPKARLQDCVASENFSARCTYGNLPNSASILIFPDVSRGDVFYYGACDGIRSSPCVVKMDQDQTAIIEFRG